MGGGAFALWRIDCKKSPARTPPKVFVICAYRCPCKSGTQRSASHPQHARAPRLPAKAPRWDRFQGNSQRPHTVHHTSSRDQAKPFPMLRSDPLVLLRFMLTSKSGAGPGLQARLPSGRKGNENGRCFHTPPRPGCDSLLLYEHTTLIPCCQGV